MSKRGRNEDIHARNVQMHARWKAETDPDRKQRILGEMIEANRGLINSRTNQYRLRSSHYEDDMQQVGVQGLIKAIERWDPEVAALSTYAYRWIQQEVQRYWLYHEHAVHIPEHARQEAIDKAKAAREEGNQEATWLDYIPSARDSELSDTLMQYHPGDDDSMHGHEVYRGEMERDVRKAFDGLTDQQRKVMELAMHGMLDKDIAVQLEISRARVGQLREQAYQRLRELLSHWEDELEW